MAKSAIEIIQEIVQGQAELNVPMNERTTMRAGGPADIFIKPESRENLAAIRRFFDTREIELLVLGGGSSVIVRDGGIRGAVLQLGGDFDGMELLDDEPTGPRIKVGAGTSTRWLVRQSVDLGFTGLEYLYGIPGTLGGAVMNNAGSWGHEMSKMVVGLETMDSEGEVHNLTPPQFRFEYRRAILPEGHIVLSATLEGSACEPGDVKDQIQKLYDKRRSLHPLHEPCAGMTFFNPKGACAGEIIDHCGLKGVRVGDAEISRMHGNFIVNLGLAQAAHIVSLIGMIQERVYVREKIKLEPKVKMLGNWQKSKLRIQE
jgi:UDP-N-acetylmuramate dehydrogenase